MQGAAPSPSSPTRRWGSPLLFPCWGLGRAAFGPSQRRDGQEQQARDGALPREQGHPKSSDSVLLHSAGSATSRSVPCHPESTMLGDRSSSAHVLLWFLGTKPSPGECSCLQPGREDGGRRRVGRAVARTLANVTLSYFKIFFILLPSDKNALWSRAYRVQFGTYWGRDW